MTINNLSKWDKRFIELANLIATWSKDTSKVGCVVVGQNKEIISTGYNGFPYNVKDNIKDRNTRPQKYFYTVHAEQNALILAARRGTSLIDSILYLSEEFFPCADCAKLIIQSGIKKIVCSTPNNTKLVGNWKDSITASYDMLLESNINLILY